MPSQRRASACKKKEGETDEEVAKRHVEWQAHCQRAATAYEKAKDIAEEKKRHRSQSPRKIENKWTQGEVSGPYGFRS